MKTNLFDCLRQYLDEHNENVICLAQKAETSKNTLYRALGGKNISLFAAERLLRCAGFSLQAVPMNTPAGKSKTEVQDA